MSKPIVLDENVERFAERLESAASQDACFEAMLDVARSLGFSSLAYDYTPVTRAHDGQVIPPNLLRTWDLPDDFEDLWLNHGYYAKDVAWIACHTSNLPFVWSCESSLVAGDAGVHVETGPAYREFFEYLADTRLSVGINVPVHAPGGGLATVNALRMNPEPGFMQDARRAVGPFAECAQRLHAAVSRFFDTRVLRCRHVRLSEREIECLRLSAQGYTTEQVADRIFRSVPTAALHLKNAAQKLGARNRAQAIARAAHYRLLDGAV